MQTETCERCSTAYQLEDGLTTILQRTPPDDVVIIWAAPAEARIPDPNVDDVVHRCHKGVPVCYRCGAAGRVGNAVLGIPPAPLECLRCARKKAHEPG